MKVFTNSTYFAIFWPNKGWILPLFLFTLLIWDTSQFCRDLRANRPHRTLVSPNQTYLKQNYLTLYAQRRANLPTYWKFTILFIIFKNNSRLQCFSWRVFQKKVCTLVFGIFWLPNPPEKWFCTFFNTPALSNYPI